MQGERVTESQPEGWQRVADAQEPASLAHLTLGAGGPGPKHDSGFCPRPQEAPRHCTGSSTGHVPDTILSLFPGMVGHGDWSPDLVL